MTFKEALAALAAMENGADLVEAVQAEVSKKNSEAQNLRTRTKAAEDAVAKVTEKLGLDKDSLDSSLEEVAGTLETVKNSGGTDGVTKKLSAMEKQLKALEAANKKAEETVTAERTKRQNTTKKAQLQSALTKAGAIKPEVLAKVLDGSLQVKDDDSVVFLADDGTEKSLEDGVKGFLETNPEFVSNTQKPGAGSAPGGGGEGPDLGALSMEDYIKARSGEKS